jgi:hypothetical protein
MTYTLSGMPESIYESTWRRFCKHADAKQGRSWAGGHNEWLSYRRCVMRYLTPGHACTKGLSAAKGGIVVPCSDGCGREAI